MTEPVDAACLATLFTEARTANGWTDEPVSDEVLTRIDDFVRLESTSANCGPARDCGPARFVFVRSPEGKAKLEPALSTGNRDNAMAAPVTAIVAHDLLFHDQLPRLFPHADARSGDLSLEALAAETDRSSPAT